MYPLFWKSNRSAPLSTELEASDATELKVGQIKLCFFCLVDFKKFDKIYLFSLSLAQKKIFVILSLFQAPFWVQKAKNQN